jgi:hypothetical protein
MAVRSKRNLSRGAAVAPPLYAPLRNKEALLSC